VFEISKIYHKTNEIHELMIEQSKQEERGVKKQYAPFSPSLQYIWTKRATHREQRAALTAIKLDA